MFVDVLYFMYVGGVDLVIEKLGRGFFLVV